MSVIDNNLSRPVLAIDFDGTLCDSKYPECGPPIEGAREALELFRAMGYAILIYSCRSCSWHGEHFSGMDVPVMERPAVVKMCEWLDLHQLPYDEIDDGSKGKPLGTIICDRALRFERNWPEIALWVLRNRPT